MTKFTSAYYDGFVAVIFDMDGLLIDSEPLWWRAEILVLGRVGVPLNEELCWETMGTRVDEMVAHWHERFPWQGPSIAEVASDVLTEVGRLILAEGKAMPGAVELVRQLAAQGRVLAVASSSPRPLIDAVLETIGLEGVFADLFTAADEVAGKPDPAVYVTAARKLGVAAGQCLVFEDSMAGIKSGKGAGMTVVAVSPEDREVDTSLADERVDSLGQCLPDPAKGAESDISDG